MPKISDLTAGTVLVGSELIPAVQSGVTVRVTPDQIATYTSTVNVGLEVDNTPIVVVTHPAQDFLDRLVTPPAALRETQYRTLIDTLDSAGIWDKLDCLYILAAADRATADTNLIQTSYGLTEIGTPTFTVDVGFTGNGDSNGTGTMRLDSSFTPSIVGPTANLVRNSVSLFAWSNTSTAQSTLIGTGGDGTTPGIGIFSRYSDNFAYGNANDYQAHVPGIIAVASVDGKGLWSACRTGATAHAFYKNGVSIGTNAAPSTSLAVLTGNLQILGFAGFMSGHQVLAAGWGAGLDDTENLALYNALHTYLQAVAGIA